MVTMAKVLQCIEQQVAECRDMLKQTAALAPTLKDRQMFFQFTFLSMLQRADAVHMSAKNPVDATISTKFSRQELTKAAELYDFLLQLHDCAVGRKWYQLKVGQSWFFDGIAVPTELMQEQKGMVWEKARGIEELNEKLTEIALSS